MELGGFTLEELILTAIKSEIGAREVYRKLRDRVKNSLLRDRLNFLSEEEEKHRVFFEELYLSIFPERKIELPEQSPVPLPELKIEEEVLPISQVLSKALDAEMAAYDFYNSLVDLFPENPGIQKMLGYIANMELGHYKLLEIEKENAEKFEDFDTELPLAHMGP